MPARSLGMLAEVALPRGGRGLLYPSSSSFSLLPNIVVKMFAIAMIMFIIATKEEDELDLLLVSCEMVAGKENKD
ncbi:putative ascorbate transporter, chloroplastic-like isoform [Sesbania bispinosa]|nr:putative ascorbate transporter, chloroplastic-like isoform [Sesbania bispinosa]